MKNKYTSPRGGRRACLCWDTETYSIDCCDGSLHAQGIGSITASELFDTPWQGYYILDCASGHHHNVHHHGTLEVGKTYYLQIENNDAGCHTVVREQHQEGFHIVSVGDVFDTCEECNA